MNAVVFHIRTSYAGLIPERQEDGGQWSQSSLGEKENTA
ncbi:hypothetical protein MTO96_049236 [Rhipicephalus appendiculatus]